MFFVSAIAEGSQERGLIKSSELIESESHKILFFGVTTPSIE
jgi:2',3'-cyclic-nucleotide 2'-phosphodiesterase (5'-nucleotidase family)